MDSNGYFRDPWGNLYLIKPDTTYDSIVSYYDVTNSFCAIVSYGPDGSAAPPNRVRVAVTYVYIPNLPSFISAPTMHTYAEGRMVVQ